MGIFANLILAPHEHYLQLLEFLAVMSWVMYLPYVGVVLGSTALSLWLTFRDHEAPSENFRRFGGDLINTFLTNKFAMLIFGFLPVIIFPIIYSQWFYQAPTTTLVYIKWTPLLMAISLLSAIGYASTYASRNDKPGNFTRHMLLGLQTVGLLKLTVFVLLASVGRLADPEEWFRVRNIVILLLHWNAMWKFLLFLHLASVVTGASILFFFFKWPGSSIDEPASEYAGFVRKFGAGLALAFCMAVPVFNLFFIWTSPDIMFGNDIWIMAVAVIAFALFAAVTFVSMLAKGKAHLAATAFVLVIATFFSAAFVDVKGMAHSNAEHRTVLVDKAKLAAETRAPHHYSYHPEDHAAGGGHAPTPTPGPSVPSGDPDDLARLGEILSQTKGCIACHSVDGTTLVGPSYKDQWGTTRTVVTAGSERQVVMDEAYVRNSILHSADDIVKGFQNLMPSQQGLVSDKEVEALVAYIKSVGSSGAAGGDH